MPRVIFFATGLLLALSFSFVVYGQDSDLVTAEQATQLRQSLSDKVMQTLLVYQQKNKQVSLAIRSGIFVRGRVIKTEKKQCQIEDYQKKIQVVAYEQIKARYLATLVTESSKHASVLFELGQLLCHEGEMEWAQKYLRDAAGQGIDNARTLLQKIEEQKNLQEQSKRAENDRARAELERKIAEDRQKAEAAKKPRFQWYTDFPEAQKLAQQQEKLLFVDFTGSDWCGWCIRLDKEVFSTPEFETYAAATFVCVKLDFPRRKELPPQEKQQNEELASKYRIRGYPTVLIMKHTGHVVASTGYVKGGPQAFIEDLNKKLQQVTK